MFNIGAAEILLLLLIAFVVVGPKDLPKVARALGRAVRMIRGMIRELKEETGFDEIEREFHGVEEATGEALRSADVRADLRQTEKDINHEMSGIRKELSFSEFKKTMGGKQS